MSSAAAQYRNEKKRMEDAVARVREVVHTASKNDIILALHNFDLDVNKTIQAFCDDGAQSALGSWEQMGSGGHKKSKNQKKKKGGNGGGTVPVSNPAPSKQPTAPNGHLNSGDVRPSGFIPNGGVKTESSSTNVAPVSNVRVSSVKQKAPLPLSQPHTSHITDLHNSTTDQNNTKVLSTEISNLKGHEKEIEKIETAFKVEIDSAEQNIRTVFKDIRQLLSDRENHLLAELKRARDDGARVLNERRVQAVELYDRGLRMGAMSEQEQLELGEEMTSFNALKLQEMEIGHATRFLYDNADIIKMVKNFGQVVGVKSVVNGNIAPRGIVNSTPPAIKHATSHSSINSSLGEDSGLGHISPLTIEKRMVTVSNGGINMKSDALSADELANINKKLQETLKAQGIDASVISGISSGTMPTRRRPAGHRGGTGKGGNYNHNNGNGARKQNGSQSARMPDLSILQS